MRTGRRPRQSITQRTRRTRPQGALHGTAADREVELDQATVVTILFTDLVASTETMERIGDDRAEELRRAHFRLVRDAAAAHGGRTVKSLGDGLMIVFASAIEAVVAAATIQQRVATTLDGRVADRRPRPGRAARRRTDPRRR